MTDGAARARPRLSLSKHIILFLAANLLGSTELALDEKTRAVQREHKRSGHRNEFGFVAALGERCKLKPTIVDFSRYGSR